ncbi:MAG TPA: hypothetical protein VII06_09690 [Chloroflexota bacterium]
MVTNLPTTREEWEAAQWRQLQRLIQEHPSVKFHLDFKDGRLSGLSYEVGTRWAHRGAQSTTHVQRDRVTP